MALTTRQRARLSLGIQAGLFIALVIVLIIIIDWTAIHRSFFDIERVRPMFPEIITVGLINTLQYTAVGFVLGLLGGTLLALMKLSSFPVYRWLATAYIEFFRGIPAILVFLALGFGVSIAFGWNLNSLQIAGSALGLVASAYIAETLRAGLQAVPKGQVEAARALGMPAWRAMVSIQIPQAFRIVLPPLTNEAILLTKDSSLIFVVGLTAGAAELTKFGRDGINIYQAGLTPLVAAGVCYLLITVPLSILARRMEQRSPKKK
ncbi:MULTISPECIES: amino acid ABC transporter permease [Nesterenkonia]|uniref:Polar amino acid transport system permease protein n=1 Tax=Nesterenkonia xinjiangensis TaxID=225327 RepID=A0A7Z0K9P8_9MICC|nr:MULTISPECIES: amino acid ABC transporter permease [Nesterenkonia]MDZ5076488.1 amino acid ABC transporter permease [Nesterenkonia sp. HG001]NYJ77450.1 polar amino acid transport system permease protein [Nesterenkonia xinjiangensis]